MHLQKEMKAPLITMSNSVTLLVPPQNNVLLVIGDCNAHLGPGDALHAFHDKSNNNGKLLLDYSIETNLTIANIRFQKKRGKLFTFMSEMNNRKYQINYTLLNNKWKNCLKNC